MQPPRFGLCATHFSLLLLSPCPVFFVPFEPHVIESPSPVCAPAPAVTRFVAPIESLFSPFSHMSDVAVIIIQGVTTNGRAFRPSDWAERLCGIMSTFERDQQMRYSSSVRPIMLDGVRCVLVECGLAESEPRAYRFLLDFAKDNELNVIDPTAPLPEDVCPVPGQSLDELVAG
jgi:hypothetical protein